MVNIRKHKNFCPMPWMHFYKDTDHTVKLCCNDRGAPLGNFQDSTFEEIRNNDEYKKIRKQFLNDERPERCKACWFDEDNGRHSLRTSFLSYTEENQEYTEVATDPITYLDYRTSNLCNLGCKICIPHFSSKLAQIFKNKNLHKVNKNNPLLDKDIDFYVDLHKSRVKLNDIGNEEVTTYGILSPFLSKIYFAGGEPILSDEHWNILDELIEKNYTRIKLMYNTNFTLLTYKGRNLLDTVKQFKEVVFNLSLDGIEKSFEYWRTGGKWQDIQSNLDYMKSVRDSGYDNVIIGVTSAVGWMNFKEVFRLHKYLVDNGYIVVNEKAETALQMQPVLYKGVSFEYTPKQIKDEILECLDEYDEWRDSTFKSVKVLDNTSILRNLVNNSIHDEDKLDEWVKHNCALDDHFGTKFDNVYNFRTEGFNKYLQDKFNRFKV